MLFKLYKIIYIPKKIIIYVYNVIRCFLLIKPQYIGLVHVFLGTSRLKKIIKSSEIPYFKSKNLRSYDIFSNETLSKYKLKTIEPASFEQIQFPRVYNLSNGGSYGILFDEVSLYLFENAIHHPYSDFIRVGEKVFWDKLSKPQFRMIMPQDNDLIVANSTRAMLKGSYIQTFVKCGFSLLGVHSNSWGHFISNYLPKLDALEFIDEPRIELLLPINVDDHIRKIIELICSSRQGVTIRYINQNEIVCCDKLYYCTSPSFIADHSNFMHPSFVGIRDFAKRAIFRYARLLIGDKRHVQSKKLYIGRTTGRNMGNYEEIEDYFINNDFEVVYPHLLDFDEKISLFAQASHVTGPGSSGFFNLIFCQQGTKALTFSNYARTLDLYTDLFSDKRYFNIDINVHYGYDNDYGKPHSNYNIKINDLINHIDDISFLNKNIL